MCDVGHSLSDPGGPGGAAEPGGPRDAEDGPPAGRDGHRDIQLQHPPTHTALPAIEPSL